MALSWLNQIGDWNPQLFRELKGRLKSRGVLAAIALSLLAQFLLLAFFYNLLPFETTHGELYNRYCTGRLEEYSTAALCLKDAAGNFEINWQLWWLDLFRTLNWTLPFLLIAPGIYGVISDLGEEERRGTLNFIRLSPRSSYSILLGKLLGVPVLTYLATALVLPLHWIVAAGAGAPLIFLISFYVLLIAGCCFLYSAALLFGFLGKAQAGSQLKAGAAFGAVFFTVLVLIPLYLNWNRITAWQPFSQYFVSPPPGEVYPSGMVHLQWLYLPLGQNSAIAHAFTLLNLGLGTYLIWQALKRCFHSPSDTIISKKQSYGLVAYFEVFLLGFCLQNWKAYGYEYDPSEDPGFYLAQALAVCSLNLFGFLALIAILSTQRQALLDWMGYRQVGAKGSWRGVIQDLIWGEKSPAVGAIALNLLIAAAILVPWILLFPGQADKERALLGLVLTLNLVMIYAAIAQLALLMKAPRRVAWASGLVSLASLLPAIIGAILATGGHQIASGSLLLFSPFFWISLYESTLSLPMIYLGILAQWAIFGFLGSKLARQLRVAGRATASLNSSRA